MELPKKEIDIGKMFDEMEFDRGLVMLTVYSDPLEDPEYRVRITRRRHRDDTDSEYMVKVGKPSYTERERMLRSKRMGKPIERTSKILITKI